MIFLKIKKFVQIVYHHLIHMKAVLAKNIVSFVLRDTTLFYMVTILILLIMKTQITISQEMNIKQIKI